MSPTEEQILLNQLAIMQALMGLLSPDSASFNRLGLHMDVTQEFIKVAKTLGQGRMPR